MSNLASIQRCIITDIKSDNSLGYETAGIRVYDNYDQEYGNFFEKEALLAMTPAEILEAARGLGDRAVAIIDAAEENKGHIEIDGVHYSFDELTAKAPKL